MNLYVKVMDVGLDNQKVNVSVYDPSIGIQIVSILHWKFFKLQQRTSFEFCTRAAQSRSKQTVSSL